MNIKINPCNLTEKKSKILCQFLNQTPYSVIRNKNWQVNIEGKKVSFKLTHTLICRPRIEHNPQKAGYRYEVMSDQCLGSGSFGKVYSSIVTLGIEQGKLFPIQNGKSRVIKIQKITEGRDESYLSRQLSHLHMKPMVIDDEKNDKEEEKESFLVFKKMPGENLQTILKKNKLTINQKIQLSIQIVQAYQQQVLKSNLVHRDLKPENIMVDLSDQVALPEVNMIDFGLAKAQKDSDKRMHVGSFGYMAPEILVGQGSQTASDIYSLGCILIRIFAEKNRLNKEEEKKISQLFDKIEKKEVLQQEDLIWKSKLGIDKIKLDEIDPKIKEQLIRLLRGMVEINPKKRITTEKIMTELSALKTAFDNTPLVSSKIKEKTEKICREPFFFVSALQQLDQSFLQKKIKFCCIN